MSIYQNYNSTGSSSNFSSMPSAADKIRLSQANLQEIHAAINFNRQQLYNHIGFSQAPVASATFNNDMNAIQKQFNFVCLRRNKQFGIYLKEQLLIYYDKILEQKQMFIKRMNYIRKYNIVSPEIVKQTIAIEKYFEIKNDPISNQDEEDFDSLEIPEEIY